MNDQSIADEQKLQEILSQILSDPEQRIGLITAIRECRVDYSFPACPVSFKKDREAFIDCWNALANALYVEANQIRAWFKNPAF